MIDKVLEFQQGNEEIFEEILEEFRGLLTTMSYRYYVDGMNNDDLFQLATMGLLKAVQTFDPDKLGKFEPYGTICAKRMIFTAIKSAHLDKRNLKDMTLEPWYSNLGWETRLNARKGYTPEEILIAKELKAYIAECVDLLPAMQKRIFRYSIEYDKAVYASEDSDLTYKQIDNGFQRIKAKLKKCTKEYLTG